MSTAVLILIGPATNTHAQHALRIVTFNVQCLQAPDTKGTRLTRFRWNPARQAHLESVASVIETLEPDVCALVEVTTLQSVNRLVEILHSKGLDRYQGYHVESQDKFTGFDVAFITKVQPDRIDGELIHHVFSPSGDEAWRADYAFTDDSGQPRKLNTALNRHGLIYMTLAGHKLAFLGLHLKSNPSGIRSNALRTAEATIATRILRAKIVDRGYLPVVLGDLNDYDPDIEDRDRERSTLTRVLRMLKDYDESQAGDELINTAVHIKRIDDRYTSHWDVNENRTADEGDVFTMLDYVLLPKSLESHVHRAFVCRLTGLSTSDHWPLVVDLVLPDVAVQGAITEK